MTIRALIAANASISTLLESALSRYGFVCTSAVDSDAAAAAFANDRFDVVVIDTWLAKKPGLALAAELRGTLSGRSVGVCILNADPGAKRDDAMKRGLAEAWFEIPFSPADVRKKLAELALQATGAVADEMPTTAPSRRGIAAAAARAASPATATAAPFSGVQSLRQRGPAELLIDLCRAQATGVLVLRQRLAEARIAIARGVVVGASDNGHDNRLGPRLLRRGKVQSGDASRIQQWMQDHKGRIGDAVLGLGLMDAASLLDELRAQADERLLQAVVWEEGDARFVRDDAEVLSLSVDAFDVIDVVLRAHMREPDDEAVARFVASRADDALAPTLDFEEGLVAYARLEPRSPLPLVLMSASTTLHKALATLTTFPPPAHGTYAAHLRALWHAGLVRFASEPARDRDSKAVPRPWKPHSQAAAQAHEQQRLDATLIDAVQRVWLRVQGNDLYAALGVARDAPVAEIERALSALERLAGKHALEGKRLGPAEAVARELADFFDEVRTILLEPNARTAFDEELNAKVQGSEQLLAAEELFLQGKLALNEQSFDKAAAAFAKAVALTPDDAEMRAWLGWVEFLDAAERLANSIAQIKRAAHDNPSAARPLLFLARVAEQQGDHEAAARFTREARRKCPDDPDVNKQPPT